jgi:haloacetate dehalogenase
MAQDMVDVTEQLGHRQFFLAGHDRGGRTSHRMCLDHPERVMKVCLRAGGTRLIALRGHD